MSSKTKILGCSDNWWWEAERPIEELEGAPIEELNKPELRRLVDHKTPFNLAVDQMPKHELRDFLRDLRAETTKATPCVTTYERARWKAHYEFRKRARKISKVAKYHTPCLPGGRTQQLFAWLFRDEPGVELLDHDPLAIHRENCEVELSDPELYVAKEWDNGVGIVEYGQYRHRKRSDPEHGYIGGVAFPDMPMDEFEDIVQDVLADLKARHSFTQDRIDGWLATAKELKQTPTHSDLEALTQVLVRVFFANNDQTNA